MSPLNEPSNPGSTASWPLYSVRNAAARWLTTINYDLLVFQDKLVVSRGISWRTAGRDLSASHTGGGQQAAGVIRLAQVSTRPEAELLAEDEGNRVVRPGDVETARLGRRLKLAHLKIRLKSGKELTYKWLDWPSHNGDYDEIHRALRRLLGAKLQA